MRDGYGRIIGLKLIDPTKVKILVADDDSVFYQITGGTGLQRSGEDVTIPAREIIHDRGICLKHPLVGVSPITAAALAAGQGMAIQGASSSFFANGARPSGVLTAPGAISQETAARLKADWEVKYTGNNAGKTAVLGDGLKFESMTMTAVDAQLLEQLQFTDKQVCTAFGVPAWKIGIGEMPTYNGSEAGQLHYYQTTIQTLLESLELCLDTGFDLPTDSAPSSTRTNCCASIPPPALKLRQSDRGGLDGPERSTAARRAVARRRRRIAPDPATELQPRRPRQTRSTRGSAMIALEEAKNHLRVDHTGRRCGHHAETEAGGGDRHRLHRHDRGL